MPTWAWVLIAVAIVAVVVGGAWQLLRERRTARLRDRFGPEYERVADRADSRREAEAELDAREERRRSLDIRPLNEAARMRYMERWNVVQAEFVDDPRGAITGADSLIRSMMADRGYPVEDFEQRVRSSPSITRRWSRTTAPAARSPSRRRPTAPPPRSYGRRCATIARSSTSSSSRMPTGR